MVDHLPSRDRVRVFLLLEGLQRRAGHDMSELLGATVGGLRGSHGRILGLVPDEGARPSALAGGWMTKQAVSARVKELVEMGWVDVAPDPHDGRAVVVRLTDEGRRIRDRAFGAIAALEAGWAQQVGDARYEVFRGVLSELADGLMPIVPTTSIDNHEETT